MADGEGFFGEGALGLLVGLAAFGGFDGDGVVAEVGEVVGAGAHVEDAAFDSEGEGLSDKGGTDPGPEFGGPLVEVHVGVEAGALLHFEAGFEGGLEGVERGGGRGEEAVGVVVGAAEGLAFDEGGELVGGEAEGVALVADLLGSLAIDHGPFVEAEAAEARGAVEDVAAEGGDPGGELAGFFREQGGIERDGVGGAQKERVVEEVGVGDFEGGAERGEPLFEFAGGEVVVAEEEVVDGVGLAAGTTIQGGVGHGGDAGVVGVGEGVPGGAGEEHAGSTNYER